MKNLSHKKENINSIGIWIETPGQSFTISEGIARVICKVIICWVQQHKSVTICCSNECSKSVLSVLKDLSGRCNDVQFITVKEINFLNKKILKFKSYILNKLSYHIFYYKDVSKIYLELAKFIRNRFKGNISINKPNIKHLIKTSIKSFFFLITTSFYYFTLLILNKYEVTFIKKNDFRLNLLKKALKINVDVWYVPRPDWLAATKLKQPIIWGFWDLIPAEAPYFFAVDTAISLLKRSVCVTGSVITMSEYVKKSYCEKFLNIQSERVKALQPPFHCDLNPLTKNQAITAVQNFLKVRYLETNHNTLSRYFVDLPFECIDFIFFPSQLREYKNFYNLVLAFEKVLRRNRRDIKLITTGFLDSHTVTEIKKYIVEKGLGFDILSFSNIPTEVLYGFMKLAKTTVCPSFFEGGFPLSFLESVKLETPVICSKMPNIKEFIDWDNSFNDYFFDPHSIDDIAKLILHVLDNGEKILEKQKKILNAKFSYDWNTYANFILTDNYT